MKIKGIIVDVGGVLVQTVNTDMRRIWEQKLHLKPGQLVWEVYSIDQGNKATIGKMSSVYIWQDIKKRFNLSTQEISKLQIDFYSGDKLNVVFYNYIKHIREKCKIVILSDAWNNARTIYTQKYHLDKITDKMILSAEEGMRKPNEKFTKLALDYLGMQCDEMLYIDDTLEYVTQARLLGIKTVYFTDTALAIEQINSYL